MVMNFLLDATRYVYGRGVMFAVSSLVVFFMIVIKDLASQFFGTGAGWFIRTVSNRFQTSFIPDADAQSTP